MAQGLKDLISGLFYLSICYLCLAWLGWLPVPQALTSAWKDATGAGQPPTSEMLARMPDDQRRFVSIVKSARTAYANAETDLAKGAQRLQRKAALCGGAVTPSVRNWVGVVESLSSNSDGFGVLKVALDTDVALSTSNNSLSDIDKDSLIRNDTDVHRQALTLRVKDKVAFDGTLFNSSQDCFSEKSLTQSGSMERPEFYFRFSRIEKL